MCQTSNGTVRAIYCTRCNEPFNLYEDMACTGPDEYWHLKCFVCAQCFKPFDNNHEYYEFGGRKYCEQDFRTLFAPCCSKCNQYIIGRFLRAMNACWHPNCFNCQLCQAPLADQGFVNSKGRAICHDCNALEKVSPVKLHVCQKCKDYIEDQELLKVKGEPYHAYHFNCHGCGVELCPKARQLDQDLYCLKCHDKMGVPICGACRRPIEERIVTALGKHFHVNHFACAECERPFLGKQHYEWKGAAYCEQHYYQLFGYHCNVCERPIKGDVIKALDKYWCQQHFACTSCKAVLIPNKSKFHDLESNPWCKKCFKKLPRGFRKKLAKERELQRRQEKNKTTTNT